MLAAALGTGFYDADDFHSVDNRAKMSRGFFPQFAISLKHSSGEPLNESDREPWLLSLAQLLSEKQSVGKASS